MLQNPVFRLFLGAAIGFILSSGVCRVVRWQHAKAVRRRWRGAALLLLPLLMLGGCANTDPNAVLNAVDDAAAIAETSVVLFTDPGPRQTALLAQIEKARQLSDLPALRRIIAQFNGTPATRPVP